MKVAVSVMRKVEYGSVILDVDDSIRNKPLRARKMLIQKMAQEEIDKDPGCIKWSEDARSKPYVNFGYMEI